MQAHMEEMSELAKRVQVVEADPQSQLLTDDNFCSRLDSFAKEMTQMDAAKEEQHQQELDSLHSQLAEQTKKLSAMTRGYRSLRQVVPNSPLQIVISK